MTALATSQLIDTSISNATSATATKSGYFYGIQVHSGQTFCAGYETATARASNNNGTRNFNSDEAGVIYAKTSAAGTLDYATSGGTAIGN